MVSKHTKYLSILIQLWLGNLHLKASQTSLDDITLTIGRDFPLFSCDFYWQF
jgi:hypothetical protein